MRQDDFIKMVKERGDMKMNDEKIYNLKFTKDEINIIKCSISQEILNLRKLEIENTDKDNIFVIKSSINDLKKVLNVIEIQERQIIMYFINIYDKTTDKSWEERYESEYLFRKRLTKLKYSKKLVVTSKSNITY